MVYTRLISGLGNQLFQYAIGRQIALLNNIDLKLDTRFFDSQDLRNYKLDSYAIKAKQAAANEIEAILRVYSSPALYARFYRRLETYLPKRYHRCFKEKEWWLYEPDLFNTSSTVYLDGYWQHYKYFENLNPLILEELKIKHVYPDEAQVFREIIERDCSAVSIHIRRGDYITDTNANKLMGVLPLHYYHSGIAYLKSKVANPTFYIFSDDLQWASTNLSGIGAVQFIDIDGGRQEQIELELMSKCRHNIIANSSFSWWGAFLNRNPDKIVVAPRQWVRVPEVNTRIQLQFPSWMKL